MVGKHVPKRVLISSVGDFMMKQKRWIMALVVTLPAWICVATAQDSHVKSSSELKSSSSKSSAASQAAATKPLTPKSAMPAPHKSSAVVPKASKNNANTSAALTRLEQQNSKALGAKSGTTPGPRVPQGKNPLRATPISTSSIRSRRRTLR